MSDATQPFDPRDVDHIEAVRTIRQLPVESDFSALLDRENDREKGPRPSVVRAIEKRMAISTGIPEADQTEAPAASVVRTLDEPGWTEEDWRGSTLFRCRFCAFQTFDVGKMYEHSLSAHAGQTKE